MRSLVVVRRGLLAYLATITTAYFKDQHNGTSCKRRSRHRYFGFGNCSLYRPAFLGIHRV